MKPQIDTRADLVTWVASVLTTLIILFVIMLGLLSIFNEIIVAPGYVKDVLCKDKTLQILVENQDKSRELLDTKYPCDRQHWNMGKAEKTQIPDAPETD